VPFIVSIQEEDTANMRVQLLKAVKAKVGGQTKRAKCPVAITSKGKYRLGCVLVANCEQEHVERAFDLDRRVHGIRKCPSVVAD
jgi:hypothetical protein